jgi:hypothetical protein
MPEPFPARERWRDVSSTEFELFLHTYPRLLEAWPPISRKARYRERLDVSIGAWPDNAVAKTWTRGRCRGYQIRDGIREAIGVPVVSSVRRRVRDR